MAATDPDHSEADLPDVDFDQMVQNSPDPSQFK